MALLMTLPLSFKMPSLKPRNRTAKLMDRGLSSRNLIGLGVGGLAAAFTVIAAFRFYTKFYRNRIQSRPSAVPRTKGNTAANRAPASTGVATPVTAPAMEQASMDGIIARRGMDTLVPAAYSIPLPETQGSARPTGGRTAREAALDLEAKGNRGLASDVAATRAGVPTTPDRLSSKTPAYGAKSQPEPWVEALRMAMEHKPLKYGYDKSAWTAPLLSHYLQETHGVSVTPQHLRTVLKDLGYHWKHTHYAHMRPGTGRQH
jgi:hypothetical protein